MHRFRSTLVLLVISLGLGAYIYFVERHREPALEETPNEQLFTFEENEVADLHVRGTSGNVTSLHRTDGTWRVIAPVDSVADEVTVSSITSSLATLEIRRVLEEGPVDLEPFGLTNPAIDISFTLVEDDNVEHLLIGEQTPTGTDRYAKLAGADRVFLIAGHLDATFDKTTFDLRDKAILVTSTGDFDGLRITTDDQVMALLQENNNWRITEPWNVRADFSTVQSLVGRLTSGTMQTIESEGTNDLDAYGLSEPRQIATLHHGSTSTTLHLGNQAPDGSLYARDASRDLIFTVEASLSDDLNRRPNEYRRKDLFGFRPFNTTRLEITQGGHLVVFEKMEGEGDDEGENLWRRLQPETVDVDQAQMDDLLAKLSNLRANSWIESRDDAGLGDSERIATIRARFGEDRTEDVVTVWRLDEDTFAVHGTELGAAKIDTQAFNDALSALETVQTEDS